ncbi:hypothetical protein OPIT5_28485 [Opitutaceae bacterium TAV5]|nr:hypothetical protein OPIT5_28485 [Opitutaceae bacterium TAV5]
MSDDSKQFITAAVIHGFAVAHAGTAAALSQTLIGDEAALTALTITMIIVISRVNGKEWGVGEGLALIGTMAGYYLGTRGLVFLVKWIPGIGNAANAIATFGVTELLGWTTYLLVRKGRNPKNVSKAEAKALSREARELRQRMKAMEERLEKMSSSDKTEYKRIITTLRDRDISETRRAELIDELERLLARY